MTDLNTQIGTRLKELWAAGKLDVQEKCCGKCAFRAGSPERCSEYGWLELCEAWVEQGQVFLCHEGVPGHYQRVEGEPIRVCSGWAAMQGKPLMDWIRLAHLEGREPDPKFK